MVSGDDEGIVKVWDYQTRMVLFTFDQAGSQTENITSVIFHPEMPIILSGSEDDTVNIYDANTYK